MKYLLLLVAVLALLQPGLSAEKNYTDFVNDLKAKMQTKAYKDASYERLAYIVDTYGPRMWGGVALEQVIYEMASAANKIGFENLKLEEIKNFTKFSRGEENLTLFDPRPFPQKLGVVGLGWTVPG